MVFVGSTSGWRKDEGRDICFTATCNQWFERFSGFLNPSFRHTVVGDVKEDGERDIDVVEDIRRPAVFGVIKGDVSNQQFRSQGLAVIEPASNLIDLVEQVLYPSIVARGWKIIDSPK